METDQFGKTTIKDWKKFSDIIKIPDIENTFEYQNAYSTYVDGLIKLNT
jgi:hypothetical protein